jgi:serine/threonine protein kinase
MLAAETQNDRRLGKVGRILLELGSKALIDHINDHDLTELEMMTIIKEVAEALNELHVLGVYHYDIKPENILLVGNQYKLCDFGSIKNKKIVYDDLDEDEK